MHVTATSYNMHQAPGWILHCIFYEKKKALVFRLQILEIKTVLHSLFMKHFIWNKLFSLVLIFLLKKVT